MIGDVACDWRCCFGTLDDSVIKSHYMAYGETMEEAIDNCIRNRVDTFKIDETIRNAEYVL